MDYQHYLSFTLEDPVTGKYQSLKETFNGLIINTTNDYYSRECMPDFEDLVDKSNTKDGSSLIDSYVKPRIIGMTVFFSKTDGDLVRFKQWVNKKYEQEFMWEDDDENKCIKVKLNKGFTSNVYYGKDFSCQIDLEFIAYDPYYRVKSERKLLFNNIELNKQYNIRSRGNVECYPIITIIPTTSNLTFSWNDLNIKLEGLEINKEYIINCEDESFYCYDTNSNKVNCISNFTSNKYYDFPVIRNELDNCFSIKSGMCSVSIVPNSRIL